MDNGEDRDHLLKRCAYMHREENEREKEIMNGHGHLELTNKNRVIGFVYDFKGTSDGKSPPAIDRVDLCQNLERIS